MYILQAILHFTNLKKIIHSIGCSRASLRTNLVFLFLLCRKFELTSQFFQVRVGSVFLGKLGSV